MSQQFEQVKAKAGRMAKRTLWILLGVGILILIGYYFWRTFSYSNGERAGTLVKISERGYVFKTFEGQLHLGNSMQMNQQSIWDFSVKNRAVYDKIRQYEGKNVSLHYHQLNDAFPWQGDTDYIVDDVRLVQ
jgi:flagellar basal body-associated protein FliL